MAKEWRAGVRIHEKIDWRGGFHYNGRAMRKRIVLFLCLLIVWWAGCGPGPRVVPEITDHLSHQALYSLEDKAPILKLLGAGPDLVLIDAEGKISKLDVKTGQVQVIFQLKFKISENIFAQNERAILRESGTNRFHIFDLKEMKIAGSVGNSGDPKPGRFIGVDGRFVLFKSKGELLIYDYQGDKSRRRIEVGKQKVFNCEFKDGRILFLTDKELRVYDPGADTLKVHELKERAASGFLPDQEHIYYGTAHRELAKLSLPSGRLKWKVKLARTLRLKPQKMGTYIVVTAEDQNIYFFNFRGTLYWWEKLDSTQLLPAVLMQDHAAVFLFPPNSPAIKFFDYKKKKTFSYELDHLIKDNPIYIDRHIYILSRDETAKKETVNRLGNRFGINIKSEPENVKMVGKSVKFELVPLNLFDPDYAVNILDSRKENVFSKKIPHTESAAFIWIPQVEGKYKMTVDIEAENRKQLKANYNFEVIDLKAIIQAYYQKVQQECRADRFRRAESSQSNEQIN